MEQPSFYEIVKAPYYIYIGDYAPKSAEIRIMYRLCHALNELGLEAYIIGSEHEVMHLRAPRLQMEDVIRHQQGKLIPITVYSGVVKGNPLAMPHVVRWLLDKTAHSVTNNAFSETDVLYAYSEDVTTLDNSVFILNIPSINNTIFHNRDNPFDLIREGRCYYANKYLAEGLELTEHAQGARSFGNDTKLKQQEIAQILRRSELLYCYESTEMIEEALLCGCPVVMIPTLFTQGDHNFPCIDFGVAQTPSDADIAYAKQTVHKYLDIRTKQYERSWQQIQAFAEYTQAEFAKREQAYSSQQKHWGGELLDFVSKETERNQQPFPMLRWYQNKRWLGHNVLTEGRISLLAEKMVKNWQLQPSFHLLILLNPQEIHLLAETLDSLQSQLYKAWGLTIFSSIEAPEVFSDVPENIEWIQIQSTLNEEIERAINLAQLDWVTQLIPGDKLTPHALLSFAETINMTGNTQFVYSDEVVDEANADIWFKPDFSVDYLRSYSYLGRSFAVSRKAFDNVGGYTGLAYVYATDLAFKVYEAYGQQAFSHIPDVLYIASPSQYASEKLLENEWLTRHAHLNRMGVTATVSYPSDTPRFKTHYSAKNQPKVSIVIAHHNHVTHLARCLDELILNTTYINYEVIVVDVLSDIEDLDDIYAETAEKLGERFVPITFDQVNYAAAVNYGVSQANGELIVVLSCFAMTVNGNWLNEMLPLIKREDVGIVGCRVIGEGNKIIHAGGAFGVTNDVVGLFENSDITESGYMERAHCIQPYTSVSSACFCIERTLFIELGGLSDSEFLHSHYLVMDFCHKAQQEHKKVLWTPYSTVFQDIRLAEKSNGVANYRNALKYELKLLAKWSTSFRHDPFFNVNLSLRSKQCVPEVDIQCGWDVRFKGKPRIVVFPMNSSGVGEYRVIAPMKALAAQGHVELTWMPFHEFKEEPVLPTLFELTRIQPDIIYVQQLLSDVSYEFLKQVKQQTSIKIIFSLDDLVTNLPTLSDRKNLVFRDMRYRLRTTLALCDHAIVSTQPLADLCLQYTTNVTVIPNRLESSRWLSIEMPEKKLKRKPRVGWAGANQHAGDLALMADVVKTLADQVDWIFMGMCPLGLRPYVKEFHEFVSFNDYPQALANLDLDLALAPLEQHPFNEAKSNLRLLEYGIMGWPVIASDIYPYQQDDAPVTRVKNDSEVWINAITSALSEPEKIAAQGRQLQSWVRQKFVLEDHLAEWLMIFNG